MKRATLSAKFTYVGARSATTIRSRALGALILASDENVREKRADFFYLLLEWEQLEQLEKFYFQLKEREKREREIYEQFEISNSFK